MLPHFHVGSDEDLSEERRLLYVAMTRAREQLLLTYTMQGSDGEPMCVSRFLRCAFPSGAIRRFVHYEEVSKRDTWDERKEALPAFEPPPTARGGAPQKATVPPGRLGELCAMAQASRAASDEKAAKRRKVMHTRRPPSVTCPCHPPCSYASDSFVSAGDRGQTAQGGNGGHGGGMQAGSRGGHEAGSACFE